MSSHKEHFYPIRMTWTGNTGQGTRTYTGYRERAHHLCFVANSVKFPVTCEPRTSTL